MNNNLSNKKIEWLPYDLKNDPSWVRYISHDEELTIDEIATKLSSNSLNWTTKNIPINNLKNLFNDIIEATSNHYGFIIVKGFPKPDQKCSINDLKNFFLFFCKQLGVPLIQNKKIEYIYDVQYTPEEKYNLNKRGPQINEALPLHTDHGGLLGMYCLRSANNGGHTLLGNVRKIHDEIKTLRPDLLKILYEPFYGDRRGQQANDQLPFDINPIFSSINNELLCQYVGVYYHDAQIKFNDIPKFTQQQIDALNLFNTVSNNDKFILEVKLNPGDVIFVNNNRVLHGRTKFDEYLSKTSVRHLLRVWLSTPKIKSFPHYYGYPMKIFNNK